MTLTTGESFFLSNNLFEYFLEKPSQNIDKYYKELHRPLGERDTMLYT